TEPSLEWILAGRNRALAKQAVRGDQLALGVDNGRHYPRARQALAGDSLQSLYRAGQRIGRRRIWKPPEQEVLDRADPLDFNRAGADFRCDISDASGAITP